MISGSTKLRVAGARGGSQPHEASFGALKGPEDVLLVITTPQICLYIKVSIKES